MKVAGGGFEQCYNAQAMVDTESMLVMVRHVTNAANDKEQVAYCVRSKGNMGNRAPYTEKTPVSSHSGSVSSNSSAQVRQAVRTNSVSSRSETPC
jgi:hypothetical protein